jgi:hypothetical protein
MGELTMLQPFTEGKAVVQLVLPPSWVARINQLAIERGINRSALIREAIRATYFMDERGESGDELDRDTARARVCGLQSERQRRAEL